jgi:Tfp pilus assembly protein PilN
MSRLIGAYVCPRGVFGIECRHHRSGLEVLGAFQTPVRISSAAEGASLLANSLAQAGIRNAEIVVALRGFDVVHHLLAFPSAADNILKPNIEREIRNLEPQLVDPVVAWLRLPPEPVAAGEPATPPQFLVAAIPRGVADAVAGAISSAGHSLLHLTALSVACHRLAEEFVSPTEATALVAQLPDGPYLGFTVGGVVRFVVEPSVKPDDASSEAAALGEEVELGAMFVRQQFHGAQIARATVVVSDDAYPEVESAIGAWLGVPVSRLAVRNLSAGALAAFGAILDSRSAQCVSLGGRITRRVEREPPVLQIAAIATLALAAMVLIWAVAGALSAGTAARALRIARQQIDRESHDITPLREIAGRRKLVADAVAMMQEVASERKELQRGLAAIFSAVPASVQLDSVSIERVGNGWSAWMAGTVRGQTSDDADRRLNDFYRALPRAVPSDSLTPQQFVHADSAGVSSVRFQLTFELPSRKAN